MSFANGLKTIVVATGLNDRTEASTEYCRIQSQSNAIYLRVIFGKGIAGNGFPSPS
jgi:hypothetical protein